MAKQNQKVSDCKTTVMRSYHGFSEFPIVTLALVSILLLFCTPRSSSKLLIKL